MGWAVTADCYIDADFDRLPKLARRFKKILKADTNIYDVRQVGTEILFKIWGNKIIDYSTPEKIYELMKKYDCKGTIHANEFVEASDGGFYREVPE